MATGLLVVGGRGVAGHQVGHYPSYYPDEIRIEVIDPAAAARGLADETLHAYVGGAPSFAGPVPEHVKAVKSLGAFLVLSFDTTSARFASADARCAAAHSIMAGLSEEKSAGFVFHPYPLTPFHADYLHHLDRIEAAKSALVGAASTREVARVGAKGQLAQKIVPARWDLGGNAGDVILEAVPVADLLADAAVQVNGWSGPPWIREGWFHAYRLLAPAVDGAQREAIEHAYQTLVRGQARSLAEHVDLERRLVGALTSGCQRLVAGYTVKEEYFNDIYPAGIENVAYDSLAGLNAPIFIRTAKLKDYPWNGKLHLGLRDRSEAAWNPVAGFSDPAGRLIWAALGDPAMLAFPDNASWMPNRVQSEVTRVVGRSGGLKVPADAVVPRPASGALQRVGDRAFASAKVTYEVLASPFEDGTEMAVADLLYPFAFAYRWGADPGAGTYEPRLAPVLAALQQRLVGLELLRVDKTKHEVAEGLSVITQTPVLEVYINDAPGDERQVAALAPPWSTVPWHLLALMEEAVSRGYAAFSQEEAARRRVPWLDLARDASLQARLVELVAELERASFRPEPLRDLVTAGDAQARWRSLAAFAAKTGHLLVTNGPYRLKQWTPTSVVLEAVRELTYPLGFGTFDRFVNPPRALIGAATREADEIVVRAEAEMVLKAGRGYQYVKEPLLRTTTRGVQGLLVVSRYLLVGPDGKVLAVDKMHWADDGHFAIKLPQDLPPGQYTAILGIFLDGNALQPSAKVLNFRVGGTGAPG